MEKRFSSLRLDLMKPTTNYSKLPSPWRRRRSCTRKRRETLQLFHVESCSWRRKRRNPKQIWLTPSPSLPFAPGTLTTSSKLSRLWRARTWTMKLPLRNLTKTWDLQLKWHMTMNRSWTRCPESWGFKNASWNEELKEPSLLRKISRWEGSVL